MCRTAALGIPSAVHYDVAIAGLGAMGSAAAWQLAARGQQVVGFDRFRPPHGLGSSGGRSRIIREAYFESPVYVPLVRRAYQMWEALASRRGESLLHTTGGLAVGPKDGALVSGALASARAHGIPVEVLSAAEVRRRFPALQPQDSLHGVLEPRAGVLRPEAAIAAMLAEAEAGGAELRFDEPVLAWEPVAGGLRVRTTTGTVQARRLVLAAGAWMATELPGLTLPLTVQRQVVFWVGPSGNSADFLPSRLPIWLWETHEGPTWYGFPDVGDGPKVARHHGGAVTTATAVDRVVSDADLAPLRAFLSASVPGLQGPLLDAQACLYTNTPDEDFLIDHHPDCPAVLLASPCSGHGFKFAPVIGEILADLAMGRPPRFDLAPFRTGRFLGR